MSDVFGVDKDIPAPDVATGPREMAWIVDEYSKIKGAFTPGVVTGKPLHLGGSEGRVEATGRGVNTAALEAMKKINMDPRKSTAAVQGFGNVGSITAKYMEEAGAYVSLQSAIIVVPGTMRKESILKRQSNTAI